MSVDFRFSLTWREKVTWETLMKPWANTKGNRVKKIKYPNKASYQFYAS